MDLKELLGEELYNQVMEKAGANKLGVVSDGSWIPKDKFDQVNTEKNDYKKQLGERDTQLAELQSKAAENEALQAEITKLQEANQTATAQYEAQLKQLKLDSAIDLALTNAKAKNLKAAKALLDLEGMELDDQGNVKGLEDKVKALVEGEGTKFMFDTGSTQIAGASPAGGGGGNGGGQPVDTSKMTYSQLVEYMAANPDAQI